MSGDPQLGANYSIAFSWYEARVRSHDQSAAILPDFINQQ